MNKTGKNIIAHNHKAKRDYIIEEIYEAGIALEGYEVKSIRLAKVNLQDSFARIETNEAYLYNMYISPYAQASHIQIDPVRIRKLLLHRHELNRLYGLMQKKGYSLIPLDLYFKKGIAKITLAVGKGKVQRDKRDTIKKRELKREIERNFKVKNKI